jgi:parallel beta-helix repeat protein
MTVMHTKTAAAAAVLAGALTLFASPALAKPPLTKVKCGDTLTHSVRLTNDLTDCTGDGLVIGADGITVDLNRHTIDGNVAQPDCPEGTSPSSAGISNGGHDGLTIKDGVVRQFDVGITAGGTAVGMADSYLHDLTVRDNRFGGITLGSDQRLNNDNRIEHNVASGSGCSFGIVLNSGHGNHIAHNLTKNNGDGMLICCSDHNVVEDNTVSGNQHNGILVCCGPDSYNVIQHNVVTDNGEAGIWVCCDEVGDQHNRIAHNEIFGNGTGVVLDGVDANQVSHNRVFRNNANIIVLGNRNTVTDNWVANAVGEPSGCDPCGFGIVVWAGTGNLIAANEVSRTLLDGIRIAAFEPDMQTVDTVVRDNRVRDATVDGFSVATEGDGTVSGTLIKGNVAIGSGDDGFDIRNAATTLTRNLAVRNGDLGIEAVDRVINGGGNKAFANGNPAQCTGVVCR